MAWDNTKLILRNTTGEPVPQVWDDTAQAFVVYEGTVQVTGSDMEVYGNDAGKSSITPTVTGVAFVAIDTKKIYLWDGSAWVEFIDLS